MILAVLFVACFRLVDIVFQGLHARVLPVNYLCTQFQYLQSLRLIPGPALRSSTSLSPELLIPSLLSFSGVKRSLIGS